MLSGCSAGLAGALVAALDDGSSGSGSSNAPTTLSAVTPPSPQSGRVRLDYEVSDAEGERFDVDESLDFAAWASRHRFIFSQVSTTFVEPYLLGIPIISLDRIIDSYGLLNHWDGYISQDASELPATTDDALDVIKRGPPEMSERKESVEKVLEECHGYRLKGSGLMRSAEIILERLSGARFPLRPRMPRLAVELRDWLSFKRVTFRDPDHTNFSYKSGYHEVPAYFDRIVDNILLADSQ